jgi:hypothetical protein
MASSASPPWQDCPSPGMASESASETAAWPSGASEWTHAIADSQVNGSNASKTVAAVNCLVRHFRAIVCP